MAGDLAELILSTAPERKIYERTPLALALCQVRFVQKYRLTNKAAVAPFQEAIESLYPLPNEVFDHSAQVQIGGPSGTVEVQSKEPSPRWTFADPQETWTVSLAPDFVSLETRHYEHFEDFINRLSFVLTALIETVQPTLCRRIGLRYIDEIREPGLHWSQIIRPELLGVFRYPEFASSAHEATQVMSLRTEPFNVNLQHGLFPKGTTVVPVQGQVVNQAPFYLLDVDVYQDFNAKRILMVDKEGICDHVGRYHSFVSALFRWATTDAYRASLGEVTNARQSADR